jgi:hypothetical protein
MEHPSIVIIIADERRDDDRDQREDGNHDWDEHRHHPVRATAVLVHSAPSPAAVS